MEIWLHGKQMWCSLLCNLEKALRESVFMWLECPSLYSNKNVRQQLWAHLKHVEATHPGACTATCKGQGTHRCEITRPSFTSNYSRHSQNLQRSNELLLYSVNGSFNDIQAIDADCMSVHGPTFKRDQRDWDLGRTHYRKSGWPMWDRSSETVQRPEALQF